MKKSFGILILIMMFLFARDWAYPKELDYLHGHFEIFKSNVDISSAMPLKLQDGKILLVCYQGCHGKEQNAIFNPETDTIEAIGDFKYGLVARSNGILLPNGKVLYIVEMEKSFYFSSAYCDELYKPLLKNLPGKTAAERAKSYRDYRDLRNEEEQAKIYMPIVKRNPELLKMYKEFNELKEKSYYAQLYNPETKEFEITGRTTNDMPRSFDAKMALLRNGNVLVFYQNNYIELYDYKTGKFTPVESEKLRYKVNKEPGSTYWIKTIFEPIFEMNDGRILGTFKGKFAIYDYDKDELFTSEHYGGGWKERYAKLSNDTIIFSREFEEHKYKKGGKSDNMGLASYDPYTDTLRDAGELLIPRGEIAVFRKIRLPDDTILILGGENHKRESLLYGYAPAEKRVEIFNPKTGVSKRIKRTPHTSVFPILLDDGRVLLLTWQEENLLFVPKNYTRQK